MPELVRFKASDPRVEAAPPRVRERMGWAPGGFQAIG